jgi:hypothetical protein
MSTELKSPKAPRKTRTRSNIPAITQPLEISDEEADAAFNAFIPRGEVAKTLLSIEIGKSFIADGDFAKAKVAARSVEKTYGAKFRIAKAINKDGTIIDGKVVIKRLTPENGETSE